MLTINSFLGYFDGHKQKNSWWSATCDCGKKIIIKQITNVKRGLKQSCGCLLSNKSRERFIKLNPIINLVNKRFGRWVVLKMAETPQNLKTKKPYWLCRCDCGNEKIVCGDNLRNKKTSSCGCYSKEVSRRNLTITSKKWKGNSKNHPQWNPNIKDSDRILRRTLTKNDKWIQKVFKRDNFTCQNCKVRGYQLNAHHLDGYHWCKEKRFWKSNGVTLCNKCHKYFHKVFGKKNNTKEQFIFLYRGMEKIL